jgi:hypothetical protein
MISVSISPELRTTCCDFHLLNRNGNRFLSLYSTLTMCFHTCLDVLRRMKKFSICFHVAIQSAFQAPEIQRWKYYYYLFLILSQKLPLTIKKVDQSSPPIRTVGTARHHYF